VTATLERLIEGRKWFHAIDFGGGVISPGRFERDVPPNYTLYGVFEWLRGLSLAGARVVDVGTMDGLVSFIAKASGAGQVIATDMARRETFEAGRERLGFDIDYRVPVSITELPAMLGNDRADVVVLAGVLYHVLDPMAVMVACRRALKLGGYAIVETMYLFDEGDARMSFSPSDTTARGVDHANVFWRPSRRALEGMCELAGFEVLGSIAVDGRISMLGRARRPSEIRPRSPRVDMIHRSYMNYVNYREAIDFDALERDTGPVSAVEYRGPLGDRRLYPGLHRPQVPFQPTWNPSGSRARYRHAARSAWFHGRTLLASAISDLRRAR
jgi:SAM-dependent methyltransferase